MRRGSPVVSTRYFLDGFAAHVGPLRKSAQDPTGIQFPKYHQLLHFLEFEFEYGPPILGYGGFWESAMKFFVKKTAPRTQRRATKLVAQVMKRLRLIDSFRKGWSAMTEHYERFFARPAAVAPEDAGASAKAALGGRRLLVDLRSEALGALEADATTAISDFFVEHPAYETPEKVLIRTELKLPQDGADGAKIFRADKECVTL